MKLKDAINLYKQEEGTPSNSYSWYRKSAKDRGSISIGEVNIPTFKESGTWCVDEKDFTYAIEQHREKIERIKQITTDYSQGIIHGNDGDIIYTEWGGYKIFKNFRYVWSNLLVTRKKSDGTWYCNSCNIVAETKNDKEECHLCRDWNGCGNNCTLSNVFCTKCHNAISI